MEQENTRYEKQHIGFYSFRTNHWYPLCDTTDKVGERELLRPGSYDDHDNVCKDCLEELND